MALIYPVIDLQGGQVVRAVRGERHRYRPIDSALCRSSDPLTVARVLSERCASGVLYIADLDALQGRAPQIELLQTLAAALPGVELWLDAGFADAGAASDLRARIEMPAVIHPEARTGVPATTNPDSHATSSTARWVPVFGSESLRSRAALAACFADRTDTSPASNAVLSLDRRDGQRLDAAGCWDAPALWPQRVIVMTLERVGAHAGPDLQTLADVRSLAPQATLIGAGGVRDAADLAAAGAAGAHAWLVASALHDRRL